MILALTLAEVEHTVMSPGESAVTWSNLALVAVTILATGVTLWLTLKDSRKHEDKAVDRAQDQAELTEEKLTAIAIAAIDAYQHHDHSADPAAIPPSITEPPKDPA